MRVSLSSLVMVMVCGMLLMIGIMTYSVPIMAAPRVSSSRVSMGTAAAAAPRSSPSSPVSTGGSGVGAAGGRGGHGEDDEPFGLADIAGGFAFKASGFVAFGGPGSAVPVVPGTGTGGIATVYTEPQQLWVVVEGRTCSDRKGRCAINAWVNVNGYQTFHIDTRLTSGGDCQVSVDEFGQGVMVIPIQFTTDGGASLPLPALAAAFPTLITVRFQAFDRDNSFIEVEGCGVTGTPTFGGPATFTPTIQNTCSPAALVSQGRLPLALTGRASRIQFRCSNCKRDDFVIAGDCIDEDNCPAGFGSGSGHGGKGPNGRPGGGGAFGNSGSLDL